MYNTLSQRKRVQEVESYLGGNRSGMNTYFHMCSLYLLYFQSTSQCSDRLHASCILGSGISYQILVPGQFEQYGLQPYDAI